MKQVALTLLLFAVTALHAQPLLSIEGATTGTWTAPATGGPYYVRITAKGGDGGTGFWDGVVTASGVGATMSGTFEVAAGQTIRAISGAKGQSLPNVGYNNAGGGGGGSGAVNASTSSFLLIAGAGNSGGKSYGISTVTKSSTGDGGPAPNVGGGGGGGGVNGAGHSAPGGGIGGGQVSMTGLSAGGAGEGGSGAGGSGMGGGGGGGDNSSGAQIGAGGGGQTGGYGQYGVATGSLPGGLCQNNTSNARNQPTLTPTDGYVKVELLTTITYYIDNDGDGFGSTAQNITGPEGCPPQGYVANSGDCNDSNAAIHPGATETAGDGIDQDCDGFDQTVFYHDSDGDGFGNPADTVHRNTVQANYVTNSNDCNDINVTINPNTTWVWDADGDSWYTGNPVVQCTSPGTGYRVKTARQAGDCNDGDASQWRTGTFYTDADGDGYTVGAGTIICYGATIPPGYTLTKSASEDCRDDLAAIHPGALEVCGNSIDDNCNGQVDEGCTTTAITSFTLINATSDKDIKTLTNGTVIDLATITGKAINIRGNTSPAKVGSVKFVLSGKQSKTQTDNALPYALFSDNSGNYNSWQPAPGSYTLKATPYAGSNGTGATGATLTLSFTVVDNTPKLSGFVLLNATSDKDIKTLTNGAVIDLAVTPAINIRANPAGNAGSVRFALNSTVNYKTENIAPFSIGGNSGSNYSNWNIAPGTYTIKATPYSADNAGGTAGTSNIITITVKRSLQARPAITTTEAGSEDNIVAENKSGGLSLYPNPTSGSITVDLQIGATNSTARLELTDLTYRKLLVETGTLVKGMLRKQIQLPATAAAGVYLLRVVVAGKVYQTKLVYAR